MKHIAGEEIKLTDYLSRHPTGEAETETNYDEEYVINALLPLFQFSARINGLADKHPTNKFTYANEEQSNALSSHLADKIGTPDKTLNTDPLNIKIIQSDISSRNQTHTENKFKSRESHKDEMDRNNNYTGEQRPRS